MIVLKVIAYSILIAVIGYFAVMSFIIANGGFRYWTVDVIVHILKELKHE